MDGHGAFGHSDSSGTFPSPIQHHSLQLSQQISTVPFTSTKPTHTSSSTTPASSSTNSVSNASPSASTGADGNPYTNSAETASISAAISSLEAGSSPSSTYSLTEGGDSTFSTSTSSPISNAGTGGAGVTTPYPDLQGTRHSHHDGLSSGALAAAVVVPILAALISLVVAALWLRRRRQRGVTSATTTSTVVGGLYSAASGGDGTRNLQDYDYAAADSALIGGAGAAGGMAMKEKRSSTAMAAPPVFPAIASSRQSADQRHSMGYYTGLDTSSSHYDAPRSTGPSSEYYANPPPPYRATKSLSSARSGGSLAPPRSEHVPMPALPPIDVSSPFDDPESPLSSPEATTPPASSGNAGEGFLAAANAEPPSRSRSRSRNSITSTLYSDDASVHSAHAARVSVGNAAQMMPKVVRTSGNWRGSGQSDPFADLRDDDGNESPVSEIGDPVGDGSGGGTRSVSPVSTV